MERLKITRQKYILSSIIIASIIIRVLLAFNGGQYYFVDEMRAHRTHVLIEYVQESRINDAGRIFFKGAHPGLIITTLPGFLVAQKIDDPVLADKVAASILSLYSVINIMLIYLIAKKVSRSERESILAALFFATATSMFYLSRHFLSYDAAMTFALLGLWLALEEKPARWRLLLASVLGIFSILVYIGNWMLVSCVMLLILIYRLPEQIPDKIKTVAYRVLWTGIGALIIGGGGFVFSILIRIDLMNYINRAVGFSDSIIFGAYAEGWYYPWDYLWNTEGLMFVVWIVGIVLAIYYSRKSILSKHVVYWFIGIAALYFVMAVVSTVLHKFVMYDRLVRQLTPLIVLAVAYGYTQFTQDVSHLLRLKVTPRQAYIGVIALSICVAAFNFYEPLSIVFPANVEPALQELYTDTAYTTTLLQQDNSPAIFTSSIEVTEDIKYYFGKEVRYLNYDEQNDNPRYWFVNFNHLFWEPDYTEDFPEGAIIYREKHPMQYKPYQFWGYSSEERALFGNSKLDMVVVDTLGASSN